MTRDGIVLVFAARSSFVEADFRILERRYRVLPYHFVIKFGAGRRFNSFLRSHRKEYGLILCWFGDVYATLAVQAARLLRKRVVVVAGGFDTTYIPEIHYGLLSSERNKRGAKLAFGQADRVLVVDESLEHELQQALGLDGTNIEVVHTGYDAEVFHPGGGKDERSVLTVGVVDRSNLKRKGFETFVEAARLLPDFEFRIVGPWVGDAPELLWERAPPNVVLTGEVSKDELVREYQRARVYAQLSRYEGLPNALAEAMLCECVPVGTPICGIPTLIGDYGFYAPHGDVEATAAAIKDASRSDLGARARERVAKEFPIEKRERKLNGIVEKLLK